MPGQLGPTKRVLFCDLSMSVMRTMSKSVSKSRGRRSGETRTVLRDALCNACRLVSFEQRALLGCRATYQTTSGISAVSASSMPLAASGGLDAGQIAGQARQARSRGGVRDEDGRGRCASLLDALLDGREDGLAEMLGACLLGVRAADDVRACISPSMGAGAGQGGRTYRTRWPGGRGSCPSVSKGRAARAPGRLTFPACP
jgi:hypothetical protein